MGSTKIPTTFDEQVKQLRDRGMIIDDESDLRLWLRTVGYYRLSGYWWIYEDKYPVCSPRNHKFKPGTSWNQVKYNYIFDQKFRRIISTGIEKIEVAVKASWANYLATTHNTSHPHEDTNIFKASVCQTGHPNNITAFDKLVESYRNSKEVFALHYKTNHADMDTPPIWVTALLLTIGELLNWIHGIQDQRDKKGIFLDFPFSYKVMLSILNHLRWVRNVCAHNGRLWNKRTPILFTTIKSMSNDLVLSADGSKLDSKIYNTLLVMAEILRSIDPNYPFIYFIKDLIKSSKYIKPALMGFPRNWEDLPIWNTPSPLPKVIINKKAKRQKCRAKKKT